MNYHMIWKWENDKFCKGFNNFSKANGAYFILSSYKWNTGTCISNLKKTFVRAATFILPSPNPHGKKQKRRQFVKEVCQCNSVHRCTCKNTGWEQAHFVFHVDPLLGDGSEKNKQRLKKKISACVRVCDLYLNLDWGRRLDALRVLRP